LKIRPPGTAPATAPREAEARAGNPRCVRILAWLRESASFCFSLTALPLKHECERLLMSECAKVRWPISALPAVNSRVISSDERARPTPAVRAASKRPFGAGASPTCCRRHAHHMFQAAVGCGPAGTEPTTGESYGSPEARGEPVSLYRHASHLMDIVGAHTDIVGLTWHRYRLIHR